MSLLQKIGKAAAVVALGIGIAAGCTSFDTSDMAKSELQREYDRYFGETDLIRESKKEIGKEAERYSNLLVSIGNDGNFYLTWNYINSHGVSRISNVYHAEWAREASKYKLSLIRGWNDRNNNAVEDIGENVLGKEYQNFIINLFDKDKLTLSRDENNDGKIDKIYSYKLIGKIEQPEDKKPLSVYDFGLVKIQKDVDKNGVFYNNETLWEGKPSPKAKTSEILSQ